MFIAKQLSPVLCCNSISLEEPSRYVDMLSHPYYGFAQLRATIMRIVFDPRNSSLSFQRNVQISIERPGIKNCPNPRMFLTITFLPYGLPQILLHILNEHDEYFQTIYSLLGNSMIRILHIRRVKLLLRVKILEFYEPLPILRSWFTLHGDMICVNRSTPTGVDA